MRAKEKSPTCTKLNNEFRMGEDEVQTKSSDASLWKGYIMGEIEQGLSVETAFSLKVEDLSICNCSWKLGGRGFSYLRRNMDFFYIPPNHRTYIGSPTSLLLRWIPLMWTEVLILLQSFWFSNKIFLLVLALCFYSSKVQRTTPRCLFAVSFPVRLGPLPMVFICRCKLCSCFLRLFSGGWPLHFSHIDSQFLSLGQSHFN